MHQPRHHHLSSACKMQINPNLASVYSDASVCLSDVHVGFAGGGISSPYSEYEGVEAGSTIQVPLKLLQHLRKRCGV